MLDRKTGSPSPLSVNFFGDDPLGPWDHEFTFTKDLGCGFTLIGFAVFLIAILVLRHFLF